MSNETIASKRRSSLWSLMMDSTVYERHEARRRQTLATQGDTRPALARIISNLPGVGTLGADHICQAMARPSHVVPPAAFFVNDDETVFTFESKDQGKLHVGVSRSTSILATGTSAAIGNMVSKVIFDGRRYARISSPFVYSSAVPYRLIPDLQVGNQTLTLWRQQVAVSSPIPVTDHWIWTRPTFAQLSVGALPVSIMFCTRAYLRNSWEAPDSRRSVSPISVAAAAVSGGVFAFARTLLGQRAVLAIEALGATVYFSVYDATKNAFAATDGRANSNPFAILGAGSLAGALYEYIRLNSTQSARRWHFPYSAVGNRSPSLLVLRAAPSHALMFLAFETVLRHLTEDYHARVQ